MAPRMAVAIATITFSMIEMFCLSLFPISVDFLIKSNRQDKADGPDGPNKANGPNKADGPNEPNKPDEP